MSDEEVYGWVLLPVVVKKAYKDDLSSYEFENDHAYFEAMGGVSWGFSEAPTFDEALTTMEAHLD